MIATQSSPWPRAEPAEAKWKTAARSGSTAGALEHDEQEHRRAACPAPRSARAAGSLPTRARPSIPRSSALMPKCRASTLMQREAAGERARRVVGRDEERPPRRACAASSRSSSAAPSSSSALNGSSRTAAPARAAASGRARAAAASRARASTARSCRDVPQAEALEQHPDPLAPLGHAVQPAVELEVLERRQLAVDERLVAEETDPAAVGLDLERPRGRRARARRRAAAASSSPSRSAR